MNAGRRSSSAGGRRAIAAAIPLIVIAFLAAWWLWLRQPPRPNIVLISLESVRADHLGCYGYRRATSPAIDSLAQQGVVFSNAFATTSWTLTAHASMFTGLYPTAHQVVGPLDRLSDDYVTLAEVLARNGYQCAGVISGPYLLKAHGLSQGFDIYDQSASGESQSASHKKENSREVEASLRRFVTSLRDRKRPFFLFAYFWDPHYDYIPPAPYDRMFVTERMQPIDVANYETSNTVNRSTPAAQLDYVISQYDGEIRWTDYNIGRFFQALKRNRLWDDTVVIVVSDHGEEFFEHGTKGHKNDLYVEATRIPLIIKHAHSRAVGHDARLTSQVDLFPTICELARVKDIPVQQGLSLLGPLPPRDRPIDLELLTARYAPLPGGRFQAVGVRHWRSVVQDNYQLITVAEDQRDELYNLKADPDEHTNLHGRPDAPESAMLQALQRFADDNEAIAKPHGAKGEAPLDESGIQRLRELGYIK